MAKSTKAFLSLSHTDAGFVRQVQSRLPKGLAYFYEESFENGENLLTAMERAVGDAAVFVLFASTSALKSWATRFEIDTARLVHLQSERHRILIFPTDPNFLISQLPKWLQSYWVSKAGYSPSDIARYITTVLLEPNVGLSNAAVRIVGRGKTLDKGEQLSADFLARHHRSPSVYVFGGFSGIGRRTFASYYMRHGLSASANLPFGPTIVLQPQTDLVEIYRGLRSEVESGIEAIKIDLEKFGNASLEVQVDEIVRRADHFRQLGQSVTVVSNNGFFEDRGNPKYWVAPLFSAIPRDAVFFVVTNRLFDPIFLDGIGNAVQLRVDELSDRDIRALMIFTADRLGVDGFAISDEMIRAIGGHADVANAAVRLVALKGAHILERDPSQLFNVQQTILGEAIRPGSLNANETAILQVLSWVPTLGGDLLEKIIRAARGIEQPDFVGAVERLLMSCLITATGYNFSISPAIRMLFRRYHVSPPELLEVFAAVLKEEWSASRDIDAFRADLFDAFVFMHALGSAELPHELRGLLLPGTLNEIVRETYARAKDEEDKEKLHQVVSWGEIGKTMKMSEATREEILSTVVRAKIRLGSFDQAAKDIQVMSSRGYRSVLFLRGHMLRKQEKYTDAIVALEEAVREGKNNRSAVHELAICFRKTSQFDKLRKLLSDHKKLVSDSAMFTDFQVGIDLARGDLTAAEVGISRLRIMPEDDGRSDKRAAQLLMRRKNYRQARELLDHLLGEHKRDRFRLRSLRAIAAARSGDFAQAKRDIDYIKGLAGRQDAVIRLDAALLAEQGQLAEAQEALDSLNSKGPEDWHLQARILELQADAPDTPFEDRQPLRDRALELRIKYNFALEFEVED